VTGISSPGSIPISTITDEPVARVAADATVADVAKAMAARDVGAVVVGDDERDVDLKTVQVDELFEYKPDLGMPGPADIEAITSLMAGRITRSV
jgi:CBS domain-containing protein